MTDKRFESAGRKVDAAFDTAAERIQKELAEAVEYVNDEVVPKVRKGSTEALRVAAKKLAKLADYMEKQKRG
ncbi:MAG: hypothetical protein M3P27_07945 [Acidobacteriota bacterium]|nr:hypothetical protein [Acidobacteriota bacterium]